MINAMLNSTQSKEQGYVASLIHIAPLLKFIQKCETIDKSEIHSYNFILFDYHYVPPHVGGQRNLTVIGDTNMILHDFVITNECKNFILENFTKTMSGDFCVYDRRKWVNTPDGMQKSRSLRELVLNFRYEPEIHGFLESVKQPHVASRNVNRYLDHLDD